MGLKKNLAAAQAAVNYVNSRMTQPSANWPGLSGLQRNAAAGVRNETRSAIALSIKDDPNRQFARKDAVKGPVTLQKQLELGRVIAGKAGGVHCGEKSVVAFTHLVENGFAAAHMTIHGGNHDFVLVSPTPLTYGNKYCVSIRSAPTDIFGLKCVVCDPWYRGGCVYPVAALWNPNFGDTIRNTLDPKLASRSGWDTSQSLATVIPGTFMLECVIYGHANARLGRDQLPPPLSSVDQTLGRMADGFRAFF